MQKRKIPAMEQSLAATLWRLAGLVALVFANGLFVAAEFSIVTVRKTRIDQLIAEGHLGARAVRRAVESPDRYIAATGLDAKDFRTGFALMAAQRHARIIGLFVRLLRRDGKPDYLQHLPRVWRMFERSLGHPALEPLRLWVDRHLPPPLRRLGA